MEMICSNFRNILNRKTFASALVLSSNRYSSYKSDLALDKIYPNSRLQIYTPAPPPKDTERFSGYIPIDKLVITYSRSSGPGGQNVNTVNTKVDVRFKVSEAEWIPEKARNRLLNELSNKINKEGFFVIKSDLTRSQHMNLADALEKIRGIIRSFEVEKKAPSAETIEVQRRRQEKASRERLLMKRQRSQVKADRRVDNRQATL